MMKMIKKRFFVRMDLPKSELLYIFYTGNEKFQIESIVMPLNFFKTFQAAPSAAIFLSGSGTNAERLLRELENGLGSWRPAALVSDRPGSRAKELSSLFRIPLIELDIFEFYRARGLETISLASEEGMRVRDEWTAELKRLLAPFHPDFGILAGFVPLTNITASLPCLNVHPGDLTVEENGIRVLAGLHRLPVENALLRGRSVLRSSVILAQPFAGAASDMDSGPILGVSAPVPADFQGFSLEELQAAKRARAGKKFAEYKGDALMKTAEFNLQRLKERGDWIVFPRAVADYAANRFAMDSDGRLLYCGTPVKTVEYSSDAPPKPIPFDEVLL